MWGGRGQEDDRRIRENLRNLAIRRVLINTGVLPKDAGNLTGNRIRPDWLDQRRNSGGALKRKTCGFNSGLRKRVGSSGRFLMSFNPIGGCIYKWGR